MKETSARDYSTRVSIALLGACAVCGCARPDYVHRWPYFFAVSAGAQPGYGIKFVVEKQKPAMLLADDGSVCRTSEQRFAKTGVGKWIACNWTLPSPDPED